MKTKQQQKVIKALLTKYNKKNTYKLTEDDLESHAKRYIKAIKQGRMICSINKVSSSGMSRTLKFIEMVGKGNDHHIYNFYCFFELLGFQKVKDSDYFRINGCGMDMIFHTNYTIMRALAGMGYCSKAACSKLEQLTPQVV